ncbi:MAG TPA: NYN domain-containing protein, partial [Streptosporangiaceae bacterium]
GPIGPAGAQGIPAGPGGPGPAAAGIGGQLQAGGPQASAGVRTYPPTAPTGRFTRGRQDQHAGQQFAGPSADQPEAGPGYVPQQGPYGGPQHALPHAPPPLPPSVSLADAVQAAHGEGFGFGQAVARDAPQLWLEAVLARKPRMPSDLEAKLLQDSALPIDSLLHDEVRHALRRGFWDALERARH